MTNTSGENSGIWSLDGGAYVGEIDIFQDDRVSSRRFWEAPTAHCNANRSVGESAIKDDHTPNLEGTIFGGRHVDASVIRPDDSIP